MLPNEIQQSVQQQANQVLTKGSRFTRFDQVRQRHFWSTYRFQTDDNGFIKSGDYDLFQVPVGQQGQGFNRQLSAQETNWPSANRVPDNQNFEILEIGFSCTMCFTFVDPDTGAYTESPWKANWYNYSGAEGQLMANTAIGITYLTNTVPLGMCNDFAQASGPMAGFYAPNAPQAYPLEGVGDVSTTDIARIYATNGFAAPGLRRRFKIPILLQHGETFKFTLSVLPGRGPFMVPPSPVADVDFIQFLAWDLRMDFFATESFVENS